MKCGKKLSLTFFLMPLSLPSQETLRYRFGKQKMGLSSPSRIQGWAFPRRSFLICLNGSIASREQKDERMREQALDYPWYKSWSNCTGELFAFKAGLVK